MGDGICASVSIGQQGRFERLAAVPYTESVGEIYALTTFLLGMVPLEHEYKLMGMAPYASPRQAEKVCADLVRLIEFGGVGGVTWHRRSGVLPLSSAHRYLEKLCRLQRFDHVMWRLAESYRGLSSAMGEMRSPLPACERSPSRAVSS
jgi:carbamoyltransferase